MTLLSLGILPTNSPSPITLPKGMIMLVQDFIDAYHTESMKQDLSIAVAAKRKGGRPSISATKKNKM